MPAPKDPEKYQLFKQHCSEATKGERNPFYGREHTFESRRRMSLSRMGRQITPEWRRRLSESMKGKPSPKAGKFEYTGMTPELAYVLGVLKGDGSATISYDRSGKRYRYYVQLQANDKEFTVRFAESLRRILRDDIPIRYHKYPYHKTGRWTVIKGNKGFSIWYNSLTLNQISDMLTTKELAAEYIRGFFDSEGSVLVRRGKPVDLSISNTSIDKLKMTKALLDKFFLIRSRTYAGNTSQGRPVYQLRIGRWDDVLKFVQEVGITIERKLTKICDCCERINRFGSAITPIE